MKFINAEVLKYWIKSRTKEGQKKVSLATIMNIIEAFEKIIEALPSAQSDVPERNVGKWIKVGDNSYMCSVCGEVSCCNGNFCPDCGARMDGGGDDGNG